MHVDHNNSPQSVFDRHFTIKCPHCHTISNLSAISIPRFEYLKRFHPKRVGIAYRCDSCNDVVFLRFGAASYAKEPMEIPEEFEEIERPREDFELKYLPQEVAEDFREALVCFSNSCFNAFAAMCRRCIQSTAMEFGTEGSTRVQDQLKDLKEMGVVDEETFAQLKQIILAGHNGAHPHLPKLSPARAQVLLELMKDVLYQFFVRQAKIQETMELRTKAIEEEKA